MGQFLRVNGDYNIKTEEGARITLDTGPGVGSVLVTGDLLVEGATVYVAATNLDIEDNIIVLNKGETGAGVTLDYSGIQIDRGTLGAASFIWNENIAIPSGSSSTNAGGWQLVSGTDGVYSFSDSRLKLKEILTESTIDGGDLLLIGQGTGVLKVGDRGVSGYETLVTDPDDVPNKQYVDDTIQNNPTFQVVSDNSRVIVSDKERLPNIAATPGSLAFLSALINPATGLPGSYSTGGESAVSVIVDGALNTQFYPNRTEMFDLEFTGSEITTKNYITSGNINLRTQGTGKIQTNYALQLDRIAGTPAFVSSATVIYSGDPAIGTTGLYYVNDSAEARLRSGELINKNKALVFSMIF
jgi:hypothetical protein